MLIFCAQHNEIICALMQILYYLTSIPSGICIALVGLCANKYACHTRASPPPATATASRRSTSCGAMYTRSSALTPSPPPARASSTPTKPPMDTSSSASAASCSGASGPSSSSSERDSRSGAGLPANCGVGRWELSPPLDACFLSALIEKPFFRGTLC